MSQLHDKQNVMETTHITCLHRQGENIKKHKLISFENKNEVSYTGSWEPLVVVTFISTNMTKWPMKFVIDIQPDKKAVTVGRAPDVTVCLLSNMISRCHAIFKKSANGEWTVRDNKSLNGVFINEKKLEPMCPQKLMDGDIVQFGVTKNSNEPAEFLYKYHTHLKIKRQRPKSMDEVDCAVPKRHKPLPLSNEDKTFVCPGPSDVKPSREWSPYQDYKEKVKQQEEEMTRKMKEYEAKLNEMQNALNEKEEKQEAMKNELEEERKKREDHMKEMEDILKKKQEEMEEEMKKKEEEEQRMKEELENRLLEKEATLLEQLQAQKEGLILEKGKIEESLREAMEKAIEEKNKTLEEELIKQKEKLESVILQKETEQKMLETQLNEVKEEKNKQTEAVLHAKEDILSNFAELMETELQCSICNELFVQATSLSCSHSFCALCIQQWFKLKKECCVCRAPVTTTMRAISLDNYIDTMVEHLSDELKERRKQLVESRKVEQLKFDEECKPKAAAQNVGRGRGRRRGHGARGGRGGGAGQVNDPIVITAATTPTNAAGHQPIILSDEDEDGLSVDSDSDEDSRSTNSTNSDDSDDSDESDSQYIHGESGAYYGGYGTCYRCGSRGHWANGCPLR